MTMGWISMLAWCSSLHACKLQQRSCQGGMTQSMCGSKRRPRALESPRLYGTAQKTVGGHSVD